MLSWYTFVHALLRGNKRKNVQKCKRKSLQSLQGLGEIESDQNVTKQNKKKDTMRKFSMNRNILMKGTHLGLSQ